MGGGIARRSCASVWAAEGGTEADMDWEGRVRAGEGAVRGGGLAGSWICILGVVLSEQRNKESCKL